MPTFPSPGRALRRLKPGHPTLPRLRARLPRPPKLVRLSPLPLPRLPFRVRVRLIPRAWRFSVGAKQWTISAVTVFLSVLVALVGWTSLRQSNDAANTAINEGARLEFLAQQIHASRLAMVTVQDSMVNDIYLNGATEAVSAGSNQYNQLAVRLRGDVNLARSLTNDETLEPAFASLATGIQTLDGLYFQLGDAVKRRGDTSSGAEGDLRTAAATLGSYFEFDPKALAVLREDLRAATEAAAAAPASGASAGAAAPASGASAGDAAQDAPAGGTDTNERARALVEAATQEAAALALAEVRSTEKDFILRQNAAYATELADAVAALKLRIGELNLGAAREAEVLAATDAYLAAFDAYAAALSNVQSTRSLIRSAMAEITTASEAIARFGTAARDEQIDGLEQTVALAQRALMAAAAGAFVIGAAGAIWLIRTMAPLKRVTAAALAISQGDLEQEVTHDSNDEIGDLGRAMRSTIAYLNDMAGAANRIAEGDVSQEIHPRSGRDVLGNAFVRMQSYLQGGVSAAGEIARGNLAVAITPAGEQDALGFALVEMRDSIGETLREASRAAEALALAKDELVRVSDDSARTTEDVARAADQVAAGTEQQSKGIERVAENMAELSASVAQVASGAVQQRELVNDAAGLSQLVASSASEMSSDASDVAQAASTASDVAKDGAERVGKTIDNIHRLKSSIDGAGTAVAELGARSSEIGKIVGVIRDIAAQTDLLALNAAIEAARAGDHGAGFAVVADEVRSLAARATAATKDITKLILDVQEGVERAVEAMNSGAADMQTGIGSASEAGEALAQIRESVDAVDGRIRGIAHRAAELQASGERMVEQLQSIRAVADQNSEAAEGMRELSTGVEDAAASIAAIAEENSASAEETSASAEAMSAQVEEIHTSTLELGHMADALRNAIARFHLAADDDEADEAGAEHADARGDYAAAA
ncbi:MAG: methyl-accepting chemotaxis protein [Dehalococcoidia bacterium]